MSITIMADSTCDLSEKLKKQYDIKIIPLYVTFDQEIYKDGVEITTKELYEKVELTNKLPKTSAAPIGDYLNAFQKELNLGNEVILFTISSFFSSTYTNALMAKEELNTDRIVVIDSKNLSTGIGLLILKAAKLREKGLNIFEIEKQINDTIPFVRSKFAIESLEYLHKGGRCSGASKLFGTLLNLKPVIEVKDGKMDVLAKTRGKRKALDLMLDDIISNKDIVDNTYIMVTHTYADDEAIELSNKLKEVFTNANVEITDAGCVISSHCGKGTIGILYIINN